MKTRTDDELNDIIRRWMGQEPAAVVNFINGKVRYPWPANAPDYCGDLNAVHEACQRLFSLPSNESRRRGFDSLADDYDVEIQRMSTHQGKTMRWNHGARQRAEALVRVIEGAKCSQKHECQCGGIDHPHTISETGCFRYMTESPILAGKHPELGCDTWKMPDEDGAITDFTLRQQRGYHQHECGCWSRSEGSFNSVDA